jgi:DNA-binding LytR/AlgR family response regulator
MIKTIIADDEGHARERLRDLLDRFDLFDIVAEAADGNEALNMIITHSPDVAFLDINMPGISVFQSLPSLKKPPIIIFQTAYSEHAAEAFDIDALDYLLKPVRYERLEKTVKKIQEKLKIKADKPVELIESPKDSLDRISVKVCGRIKIIEVKDIVRISFEKGFCNIYTSSEKFISDKYINYYEEKLKGCGFFRTSRTDLVNLEAISVIQSLFQGMYTIELKNGMSVDLSRRKAQILKKIVDF